LATDEQNGRLTGWSFLIPLENYREPANAISHNIPPAFLFGRFSTIASSDFIKRILSTSQEERKRLSLSMKNYPY
jgi:hypothetical protein